MICPNCGKENDDGCVFCAQCGKRLDGKKACPFCGKLIPEDATFCSFCGAATNGQKICRTCGKPYTGRFCPSCGVRGTKNFAPSSLGFGAPWQKLSKVFVFIAACLLLISSFLVGYHATLTSETKKQANSASEIAQAQEQISREVDCPTLFSYVQGKVREIINTANSLPKQPGNIQLGHFATLVIQSAVCIIIAFVNIAFAFGCFFHVIRRMTCGDDAMDAMEVCLGSVILSVFTETVFAASFYYKDLSGTVTVKTLTNIGASLPFLFAFVPAVVLLLCAVVFSAIDDAMYRERFSSVFLTVTNAVGTVLSGLILHFSIGDVGVRWYSSKSVSLSSMSFFHLIFHANSSDAKTFTKAVVMTDISCVLALLSMLFAALLLRIILSDFLIPDRKRVSAASIVTALALLLIGGVRIACDAMIAKAMESSVGGEPIAFTLLSLLLFIVLFSVRIVKRDSYDMEG